MAQALISAWPKLLSSLAFAAFLLCLSMKFPQPIRPASYAYMLAKKDFEINIANHSLEEVVQEYEMLLEKSERDRKYAEEICKERQPLNAQKIFLENKLGDFESFSELERKFKELEWQLEVERQLRRDEDKERHRLFDIAQLANSEVILARNSTAALNLEWQVAKIDYSERLKVVDRQRHDAVLAEAASRKELRAMRRMAGNDQTVEEGVRLGNREIDRLRAELMNKTTICDAQLAAKDRKIHDLELSLKSAQLDYADLEESFGLGGLLDEGVQEAEKAEGVEGADGAEEGEDDEKEEGKDGDREEDYDGEKVEYGEGNEVEYEAYSEEEEDGKDGDREEDYDGEKEGGGEGDGVEYEAYSEEEEGKVGGRRGGYDGEKQEDGEGNEVEYEAYSGQEEEEDGEGNEVEYKEYPKEEEGETSKKGAEEVLTERDSEIDRRRLDVLFCRSSSNR